MWDIKTQKVKAYIIAQLHLVDTKGSYNGLIYIIWCDRKPQDTIFQHNHYPSRMKLPLERTEPKSSKSNQSTR